MPARLNYTNEDYLNLFIIYGECNKVLTRTCDTFAARYPQKRKPSPNTLKQIIYNFKTHGSVKGKVLKKKPIVDNENVEIAVLGYFNAYPTISLRQVSKESGLSKSSIHRILKKHKYHPYSISIVQHLRDTDFARRVNFCEFILTEHYGNNQFLDNIIWSDEAKFTKNGLFNRHNSHYWSDSNPHKFTTSNFQGSWQFNVYCAIRNDRVVALHFYEENLNGERYLNILRNFDTNYLENLPLVELTQIFYQHDGAPPHNGYLVSNFFENIFNGQWIANNGPFLWPPRLPDLSVLDYFIWGTIKNQVYSTTLTTQENCMERVRNAFNNLNPDFLRKATHQQVILRCEKCLEVQGKNFEHLLK
ncbi:uncharacterized protein [Onthophagus taurus]|uniref:uncharacterized protein n=1 Tax=Onthophagus taurus TaxID=166361 RepID=UPI0039BE25F5